LAIVGMIVLLLIDMLLESDIEECLTLNGSKLGGSASGIITPSFALFTNCKAYLISFRVN
jgi:hypothetical protein